VASPWVVEFYESQAEGCPVRDFLSVLDGSRRAKLVALIRLLEEMGPTLPFPYSSQIRGNLRELRAHYGREHYRLLAERRMTAYQQAEAKRQKGKSA